MVRILPRTNCWRSPLPALLLFLAWGAFLCCDAREEHAGVDMYAYTSFTSDDWMTSALGSHELPDDMQRKAAWPGNKILVPSADVSYRTKPAGFGPDRVDEDGLWGTLIPIQIYLDSSENTGCVEEWTSGTLREEGYIKDSLLQTVMQKRTKKQPPSDWIALVERGQCTFEQKVRTAQLMGAKAVVVGDFQSRGYENEPLTLREPEDVTEQDAHMPLIMAPDGDASDIEIPSCFVVRTTYMELMNFVRQTDSQLRVGLYLDASLEDSPLQDIGLFIFILPALFALSAVLLQHVRLWIKRFRERASVYVVRSLPCYTWRPGGAWERLSPDDIPEKHTQDKVLWFMQKVDATWESMKNAFSRRDPEQEALVRESEQVHHDSTTLDQRPGRTAVTQSGRLFMQDECPICLAEFDDGYVVTNPC